MSSEKSLSASQARILFVDEEPVIRGFGALVLARSGYAVDTAADGAETWAALYKQEYHLLVADSHLLRLSGLELMRKMHLARISVPIILVSALFGTCPMDDFPWFESGGVLAKPFTAEQLVSVVREVLRPGVGTRTSRGGVLPEAGSFQRRGPDG